MAGVTVKLMGAAEVRNTLGLLDFAARARFKNVLVDSAMNVQRGAKTNCPVRKVKGLGGRLRGSIQVRFYNNGMTAEVGTNVAYAPYVEFGTGVRGAGSAHPPLPPGYVHGSKAGMPAQPFLYPALEAERPNFVSKLREVMRDGI